VRMSNSNSVEVLSTLKGVGAKSAEKLIDNGIDSIEKVAISRVSEISEILGWSKAKSRMLINQAKSIALDKALELKTLEEIVEYRATKIQRIPTGSSDLDAVLGGGVETDAITGLSGQFGTGKTQLCKQLAVNCKKYLDRKVAWIETEPGCFRPERILEIAEAKGVSIDPSGDIFVIPAHLIIDTARQMLAYERIEKEIKKGVDIGLLVVDSFSARFRDEFQGREVLSGRSQETARHLGYLQYLASQYNMAVVLTIQVMGIPDSSKQLEVQMKEARPHALYGGHVLKHSVTTWIALRQKSSTRQLWEATVFDAPSLPRRSAEFVIDSSGIRDVSRRSG